MKDIINTLQLVIAAVGGYIGYFLGGWDGFLYALLTFVLIDYITGLMCAVLDKRLSSEVGFRGIFKKVLIFSLVAVGHIIDQNVIGDGSVIRTAVIFFYLSNEGISILENTVHIGLPVPQKLKDILEQLHDGSNKEDNK
jgi:toxin secretion/phage lysis holin